MCGQGPAGLLGPHLILGRYYHVYHVCNDRSLQNYGERKAVETVL
jgi:hypothetical protein